MKRFLPLVFCTGLLVLAACNQDPQSAEATPSFDFSVDPSSQSVSFQSSGAEALRALQIGACGSDDPRVLFAEEELALETFEFVFLPGNILEITASFTNVTDFTFEQPFTFTQADSTSNIVSSDEPEVTDADLGGDGELGPGETTLPLSFTVEHQGQPFTYEVLAEAVVRCDDGEEPDPGDGDAGVTDIAVTKTLITEDPVLENGEVVLEFSILIANNSDVVAEGFQLTDTLEVDLTGLDGATVEINFNAIGCSVDNSTPGMSTFTCDFGGGSLPANFSNSGMFSAQIAISDIPAEFEGPITVTNTVTVTTTTDETNLEDNTSSVTVDVALPNGTTPTTANLTVTKEGDATAVTDEDGNAALSFTVVVTNNGDAIAEGVELTDTFTIDLSALDNTATLTADVLPTGCVLSTEATVEDMLVAICTLGALESGESSTLNFTFGVDLDPNLVDGETVTVTNAATATTTSDEEDLTDNTATVTATIAALPPV